jgi:alanyl-tRNA synthetase
MILVRRCSKMRQDWRVEFACGGRADRLATDDFQLLRTIADRLSCAPDDTLAAVEKSMSEHEASDKSRSGFMQHLAEARAGMLMAATPESAGGLRVICEVLRDVPAELLLPLATELASREQTVALLAAEATGQLVLAQHPSAGKDMQAVLKHLSARFPCKGGGTKHFIRAKLTNTLDAAAALDLSKSLILS